MNLLHDHQVEAIQRLFAIGAALGPAVTESLAAQRLTPARIGLVQRLHHDGPMSQRQLADALGCTPRNVTGLVDATESLGLVQRHPHPDDRRAVLVSTTQAGENSVVAWREQAENVANEVFADLADEDVEHLSSTLAVVLRGLRERHRGSKA